jgi:RHH-type proline utilization regulon transcriptional repressor/proline dehydrogenase/delta 1-pyrroline-5-carboxylate dehydrogenase
MTATPSRPPKSTNPPPHHPIEDWLSQRQQPPLSPAGVDEAPQATDDRLPQLALELARQLQSRAMQLQTPQERRQQAELNRMIQHPEDKATLTQLTDQGFRSQTPDRAVDQLIHILDVQGIPRFFSSLDRTLLRGFQSFGGFLPGVAVPLVKDKMRKETANVILPAESPMLEEHLHARQQQGLRMNVNFLGEALLGERDARQRLDQYLAALQMPAIECVSVKISTLYSQISPLARQHTVDVLCDRMELLYRAASRQRFTDREGGSQPKFVYLDMEEYRDMWLTAEVFMRSLERDGLEHARAGIALQAYVPDSFLVQQQLTQWAMERQRRGGGPVTIRLVKGANMEMERVEASLRGWPQAPYKSKQETDANFKRMVGFGMQPEHASAVHLGIASHNLFDVCYALLLGCQRGVLGSVQFEMLEGMANHQRRALLELCHSLLLYAPACRQENFVHAIGYLIRRLDENTGPDNFLRHAFQIAVDGPVWQRLEHGFLGSLRLVERVSDQPRRSQDRRQPPEEPDPPPSWEQFAGEADTDFSLPHNGTWAENAILRAWHDRCDSAAIEIPVVVGDQEEAGRGSEYASLDPSRPGVVVARYRQADAQQIKRAVDTAEHQGSQWSELSSQQRYQILRQAAQQLRIARADLIGAAVADGGKTILEADPEVSEAIDFVEFYAVRGRQLLETPELSLAPVGPVVVVSPWNFPIAIPCGGIAAALAAGNPVILKPASDTVLPAWILCQCFWRAGVPRSALQFLPTSGRLAGEHLIGQPAVRRVILTGGTSTALSMLQQYPHLQLMAETGGKNATIVSSLSDRDLALKNILHSAFSHAGQKCSATSLVLLEEELYHDGSFQQQLVDAASSLKVGSAWELATKMGPLIRPPSGELARGLKELETGERWALRPERLGNNPCLYSPAIKWNVQPGSFTHLTELFGPVLGVLPYRRLAEAIELVHATGYGLTSGLESLDDREQQLWQERIKAGNLYINRPTTGAIVLRQPFGGFGKSAVGPGLKAGSPHYLLPLLHSQSTSPTSRPTKPAGPSATQAGAPMSADADHSTPIELPSSLQLSGRHMRLEPFQRLLERVADGELPGPAAPNQLDQALLDDLLNILHGYHRWALHETLKDHDTFQLIGQDNIRRYLPISQLRIRVTANDQTWDILARIAAALAAGCRVALSYPEGMHDSLLRWLEQHSQSFAGDLEFIEEADAGLAASLRQGWVERVRYAAAERVPIDIRHAAVTGMAYVADAPVSTHPELELMWYVREQSLSVDYHRYGNLGPRASQRRCEPV